MIVKKLQELNTIEGNEGTRIAQIFHPHNTLNGIHYSISHATILPNKKSKLHKMKTSEIYYILEGEGKMNIDDEVCLIEKDNVIYIPPHSKQYIENTGSSDLRFLCIVDPAWKQTDEIVLE